MVDNTTFKTNLKFGDVHHFKKFDNTKLNKKRVNNTKFKTNLTIQAVCTIAQLTYPVVYQRLSRHVGSTRYLF